MSMPLLTTKLYLPAPRSDLVPRPRLIEQLNAGSDCKLTLISAPAGFGKNHITEQLDYGPWCARRLAFIGRG